MGVTTTKKTSFAAKLSIFYFIKKTNLKLPMSNILTMEKDKYLRFLLLPWTME